MYMQGNLAYFIAREKVPIINEGKYPIAFLTEEHGECISKRGPVFQKRKRTRFVPTIKS